MKEHNTVIIMCKVGSSYDEDKRRLEYNAAVLIGR